MKIPYPKFINLQNKDQERQIEVENVQSALLNELSSLDYEPSDSIKESLYNIVEQLVNEKSKVMGFRNMSLAQNIDLTKSIAIVTNENAKSGRARPLPLNRDAIILINSLPRGSDYVFTCSTSKRVFDIDRRDFKRACDLSGIENFHFHDLRHTWASWHVQAGTPLYTLKNLGGWETLEMVNKYAHLNADHMLEFANNVTFTAQSTIGNTKINVSNG